MEKEAKFSIKMTTADMFDFLCRHTYSSFAGLFGVLLSIGAIILYVVGKEKSMLLLVVAVIFLVGTPLQLIMKAKQQVTMNPMFKEPLEYALSASGIHVQQNEAEVDLTWENVYRVIETGKSIIVYTSKVNAYVFPKKQFQEQLATVKELFRENLDAKQLKLKK